MANTFRVDNYRSTKTLAYISMGFFGILVVFNFLFLFFSILNLISPDWYFGVEDNPIFMLVQSLMIVVETTEIFFMLAAIVIFLVWLYKAFSNLSPLKARDLEFSPGWAVGWWLIPIAQLFKPYQVVTELWRESDPEFDENLGFLSSSVDNPAYFGIWWACWIISNITANITMRLGETTDPEMVKFFFGVLAISSLFTIIAGSILIHIILQIVMRQEKRFEKIGFLPVKLPPPPPPTFETPQNSILETQEEIHNLEPNETPDSGDNFPKK